MCIFQHGAKYIYDTDDDNILQSDLSGFQASQQWSSRLVLATNNLTNNPYVHFGQSTLWPRGYPLERVGFGGAERRYSLCSVFPPAVQQGVVNGDPDVDAIFRLTRRQKSEPLRLSFDRAAPPYVLPHRTFAPFNSQNTFFASSAFWGLLLPSNSVSDRVVDIYRSYWAQRLLWLVGGGVAFAPPMAYQVRNLHSDLVDANDEAVLYRDVGRYISVLNRWECDSNTQFMFDCISKLSRHLVAEGFWTLRDADMVDAWLSDLSSVGYVPPLLSSTGSGTDTCLSDKSKRHRVVFYPVEQNTTLPHSATLHIPAGSTNWELVAKHVSSTCGPMHSNYWSLAMQNARKFPNILLVISVPGNIHSSLPSLEAIYRPHFPNILYCARHKISDEFIDRWKISVVWVSEDPALLPCLLAAGEIHYNVHGVFHIAANMFVNLEQGQITSFVDSLVWMTGEFHAYSSATLSQCYRKTISCRHMSPDILAHFIGMIEDSAQLSGQQKVDLRTCVSKLEQDPTWVSQKDVLWVSDFAMYVPSKLIPRLAKLRDALSANRTPEHDLLVSLMFECDQHTVNYLRHSTDIKDVTDTSRVDYVLPFPFEKVNSAPDATKQLCSYIEQFKGK